MDFDINSSKTGLLLVNKPTGISSNKVISIARKKLGLKKIGHCGTLDPFASGLLILLTGKATRLQPFLMEKEKTYEAQFAFGMTTDTLDSTGQITETANVIPTLREIKQVIKNFLGEVEQVPPAYSAVHINGKRAYQLARTKKQFDLPKRKVTIHSFLLHNYFPPLLSCEIRCSKGTYIRSISRDLGLALGSLGYTSSLRRTQSGEFHLHESVVVEEITPARIKPITEVVEILNTSNFAKTFQTVNKISIEKKDIGMLKNGNYGYLKKHFKGDFNGFYINEECIALFHSRYEKVKCLYNLYT